MAYLLKSHDEIVSVETAKTLTRKEREAITTQLKEIAGYSSIRGLIIDHQNALIEMTLADAAMFAESIIQLHAYAPLLFIYVIVSDRNRYIVDASVSLAATRGVPIKVCEDKSEAWNEITRLYPHLLADGAPQKPSRNEPRPNTSTPEADSLRSVKNTQSATIQLTHNSRSIRNYRKTKMEHATKPGANKLTPRESECLIAAAYGMTEKETARYLGISHNTVSVHIAKCRDKLNARNKLQAVVKGIAQIEQKIWRRFCRCKPIPNKG